MEGNVPILHIELEGLRHKILHAFSNHLVDINDMVQRQVDNFCTTENIEQIIKEKADVIIKSAIEKEIAHFYTYGAGREVIKEAIQTTLSDENKHQD